MESAKTIIRMAKMWQKLALIGKKRIPSSRSNTVSTANRGHFVIYTNDSRRFAMPLGYLRNNILQELLKISEDEYGISGDGPIVLPCDAVLMEYIVSIIQRGVAKDFEKTLISVTRNCRPDAITCSWLLKKSS